LPDRASTRSGQKEVSVDWGKIFDQCGVKRVTPTDKKKGAYVPTSDQRRAVEAAGFSPERGHAFKVHVLFDPLVNEVEASFYYSERSKEARRPPEARMGHGFISAWLNVGDMVVIGNVGKKLFAARTADAPKNMHLSEQEVVRHVDPKVVIARARNVRGKPTRRSVVREDFIRNPWVVQAALIRANNKCEMPGCTTPLFTRDDGTVYLEVHHIVPLAEMGDDTLENAAALCPSCHRLLHFGRDRPHARGVLSAHIANRIAEEVAVEANREYGMQRPS
jgi:5-methylcytosine-specific restriction endonuclease McrA